MALVLGLIGIAASVGGGVAGAKGQAAASAGQAMQQEVNRKWQEFEKQMNLEIKRGEMGIAEMDRLYKNNQLIKGSYENSLAQKRAAQEQFEYASQQFSRGYRDSISSLKSSSVSRGAARGGTAAALEGQQTINMKTDQMRMVSNLQNSFDAIDNSRRQAMSQVNARAATAPPMYLPSAPIPMPPGPQGAIMGAVLSGIGGGLGAMAGANAGGTAAG